MSFVPNLVIDVLPSPDTVETAWNKINSNLELLQVSLPQFSPNLIITGLNYPDPVEAIKGKLNLNLSSLAGLVPGFSPSFLLSNDFVIIDGGSTSDSSTEIIDGGYATSGYILPVYDGGWVSGSITGNRGYETLLSMTQKMNTNFIVLQGMLG